MPVTGSGVTDTATASATFTRPANTTAYASGDMVSNHATAGSVVPMSLAVARTSGSVGRIRRARLKKSAVDVTNAAFRVHFFSSSPTIANGDNAVFAGGATESGYLGSIDVTVDKVFSDASVGVGAVAAGEIAFDTTGNKNIYALLEARAAYTPASAEVFTLYAEVDQD